VYKNYGRDYLLLLRNIVWIDKFIIKIQEKHNLTVDEVEDALLSGAIFRRASRGIVRGKMSMLHMGKLMVDVIFL